MIFRYQQIILINIFVYINYLKTSPIAKVETLHSTLKIPVFNSEYEPFLPLENENLKILQNEFKDIDLLIIDEFSMMSQVMFGKIDQ